MKERTGKSKSDLFVLKGTKEIYSMPKEKKEAPPQHVMDLL